MNKLTILLGDQMKGGEGQGQAYIELGTLIKHHKIETYDPKQGYQRFLDTKRTVRLQTALEDEAVEVPTSLLVNIRSLEEKEYKGKNILELEIGKHKFWIVDGQHRFEAYKGAFDNNPEKWEHKLIPIDIIIGADSDRERDFFFEVNSNTKGIPGGLLQELMERIAADNPDFSKTHLKEGDVWKLKAGEIMKQLETIPVWKNKIKYPGPDGVGIIPNSGFVNGLKELMSKEWFAILTLEMQVEVLKAFWEGADLYFKDKAGDEDPFTEYKKYSIQKAVGVSVLHRMLSTLREKMVQDGKPRGIFDKSAWKDYLAIILDTEEVEFWLTGKNGQIGTYSSEAGKKELVTKFRNTIIGSLN